jgi:hypothetical protein
MIVDPTGKRIGGDGPTGREIHIIEIVTDGVPTWAFAVVGGGFDPMEILQVLSKTSHGVATKLRSELLHAKTMNKVQDDLKEK